MGVYLSEPETKKNIITGAEGKIKFVSGEMQGDDFFYFRVAQEHVRCSYS